MDRHTLTTYQRAILAGLSLGTPALARLYLLICQNPGITIAEAHAQNTMHVNKTRLCRRADQLEDIGAVRSERGEGRGRPRALYAYCTPPADAPDLVARVMETV